MTFGSLRVAVLGLVACAAAPLAAQDASVGSVDAKRDWAVFRASTEPKECWIVTIPAASEASRNGEKVTPNRGTVSLSVRFAPGQNVKSEIGFQAGYPIREDTGVSLRVGSSSFEFYSEEDWAWPANAEEDAKVLLALQRGATAIVTATSERGTTTVDTFSLLGFSAAHDSAAAMCAE
jgi:hypothetical protein